MQNVWGNWKEMSNGSFLNGANSSCLSSVALIDLCVQCPRMLRPLEITLANMVFEFLVITVGCSNTFHSDLASSPDRESWIYSTCVWYLLNCLMIPYVFLVNCGKFFLFCIIMCSKWGELICIYSLGVGSDFEEESETDEEAGLDENGQPIRRRKKSEFCALAFIIRCQANELC